jgi:putative DNA primase/helicase
MTAGMLRQARSDLAALSEDFDVDPAGLQLPQRTLRFVQRDGAWQVVDRPHDPADMLMRIADVDYEPEAKCAFWTERLALLTPDAEQLAALQPLYGYTLTGLTSDQAFYVHQGRGGDGKSATHMALAELHGDYYRHAGVKTFLQGADRGGAEHRSDLVRLRGDVRFVTCDEPKARSVWDGETIKQVTGSLITARGSGERTEVTYQAALQAVRRVQHDPARAERRQGLPAPLQAVPVEGQPARAGQEGEMPIDEVLSRLRAERSGVLNWLIAGALQWLTTRTIPQPTAMEAVLQDFWADSSPLLEWMGERCDCTDPTASAPAKDLHEDYKAWCEERGIEHVMTSTAFGRALRDKQFAAVKDSRGIRWRKGIRLLSSAERDALFAASAVAVSPARAASSPAAEPSRGAGLSDDPEEDLP